MRRPYSLQRRMGLGLVIGVVVTWLAATLVATLVIRHELDEAFDSALQETSQRLLALAAIEIMSREDRTTAETVASVVPHKELITYRVRDADGTVLLNSHDADFAVFPEEPFAGFRTTRTHRIYGESAISETLFIEIAEPLEHRREAAIGALLALLAPLLALVPFSILGVWWLVQYSMRSVVRLKNEIELRGGGDLSPVVLAELPDEISPIAEATNDLMSRLRSALDAERNFAANSAHELNTPIAAALAQTQRLITEAPPGPISDRAVQIETSLQHLKKLSGKLLQLARAEGGGLLAETEQDLGEILPHIIESFQRLSKEKNRVHLHNPKKLPLMSRMDPDVFAILVNNLVENALKHSPPDSLVHVEVGADNSLSVRNAGPVVSPAAIQELKSRFVRGQSEVTGSGLGLAIADTIAKGAHATLELCSPARGRPDGFEVRLALLAATK